MWDPSASVCVGTPETCYYGNAPEASIYDITCRKGDADNTGQVDEDDILPFTSALEGVFWYCRGWPGLCGSVLTHIDMDCDGAIEDVDDWDAFELRLNDPPAYYAQYPDCEECPSEDGSRGTPPTAEEFAATLKASIPAEDLDSVIDLCERTAAQLSGTLRGQFWADVAQALSD